MKKVVLGGLLSLFLLVFAACSTSKLTTSWTAENIAHPKFNKILVLGLLSNKNRGVKDKIEQQLIFDLKKFNQNAVAASNSYGPKAFNNLSESEALEKLANDGFDGVLTVTLVNKDTSKRYINGGWGPGFYPYYGRFWGYYSFYSPWAWGWGPGWGGGGYYHTTNYTFEANLYDVTSNNTLIYSAQAESFDPSSASNLATDFARTIVKDLNAKGLLK